MREREIVQLIVINWTIGFLSEEFIDVTNYTLGLVILIVGEQETMMVVANDDAEAVNALSCSQLTNKPILRHLHNAIEGIQSLELPIK